jgi:hypothetical protein
VPVTVPRVEILVGKFQKLSNSERYTLLSIIFKEHAKTSAELAWRAELCTELEKAGVYPQEEEDERDHISFSD